MPYLSGDLNLIIHHLHSSHHSIHICSRKYMEIWIGINDLDSNAHYAYLPTIMLSALPLCRRLCLV